MKKLASISLAVALSSCAAAPVFSQEEECPTLVKMEAKLMASFGESAIAAFNLNPDQRPALSTMFYVNMTTRTWTQLVLFEGGTACIWTHGNNFIVLPDSANGERG